MTPVRLTQRREADPFVLAIAITGAQGLRFAVEVMTRPNVGELLRANVRNVCAMVYVGDTGGTQRSLGLRLTHRPVRIGYIFAHLPSSAMSAIQNVPNRQQKNTPQNIQSEELQHVKSGFYSMPNEEKKAHVGRI